MSSAWYTQYIRHHKKEIGLFLFAFAVRAFVFILLWQWYVVLGHVPESAAHFPVLQGDSISYAILSNNLLEHGTYSTATEAPFVPDSFRLPGYPFFLYVFQLLGFPIVLITFIQILLGSGTVVLLYLLGKKFLSEKAGFWAATLLCIEPTTVFYSTLVMSDTVFVFALFFGLYLFLSKHRDYEKDLLWAFFGGLVFGFAILARVIAQYLLLFLIPAYGLIYRKELRPFSKTMLRIGVFIVGVALAVSPWLVRNYNQFGVAEISSTPYVNFTQFNLPLFYSYQHHVPLSEAFAHFAAPFASSTSPHLTSALSNKPIFEKLIHESLDGNFFNYLYFHLMKTIPYFVTDGLRDINRTVVLIPIAPDQTNFSDLLLKKDIPGIVKYFMTPQPNLWMLIAGSIPWILICCLWVFTALHAVIRRTPAMWFVLFASGFILYFGVLTGPVSEHRYRMPAAPFMLLLAVHGGILLWDIYKNKWKRVPKEVSY